MTKKTQMKKIFLVFTLFQGLALSSCTDGDKRTYTKYELVNDSDYPVTIRSYVRVNGTFSKEISLSKNGDSWASPVFETTRTVDIHLEDPEAVGGDSIVVTFDGKKRKIHTPSDLFPRSILDHRNFDVIWISDNTAVDRYTFTNEDYEEAVLIE
jgi:hypothetical protein